MVTKETSWHLNRQLHRCLVDYSVSISLNFQLLMLSLVWGIYSCFPFCSHSLAPSLITTLYAQPISHTHSNMFQFLTLVLPSWTPLLISLFSSCDCRTFYMSTLAINHEDCLPLTSFTHSWWLIIQHEKQLQHNFILSTCYIMLRSMSSPIT